MFYVGLLEPTRGNRGGLGNTYRYILVIVYEPPGVFSLKSAIWSAKVKPPRLKVRLNRKSSSPVAGKCVTPTNGWCSQFDTKKFWEFFCVVSLVIPTTYVNCSKILPILFSSQNKIGGRIIDVKPLIPTTYENTPLMGIFVLDRGGSVLTIYTFERFWKCNST